MFVLATDRRLISRQLNLCGTPEDQPDESFTRKLRRDRVSRISAIVLSATILTSAMTCIATSASALGSFHPPSQTSISNPSAQTDSFKAPYAQKTTVYGSNPFKKPFTTNNAIIPAGGGISNASHLPSLTKTFPTGSVIIPANGGISSTSHLPFPTNGAPATPASNPSTTPPSQTTTGGPVNMGPIVVAVPGAQGSHEMDDGFHHEPRQRGPVVMVDANSTPRSACGCGGFTEDGGYMTWRKIYNANGAAQLMCVKAND
jgi:hypothetical protein